MATIVKGSELVQGPSVYTWKIGTGGSTKLHFEGTEERITEQALYLQSIGYETQITSGPKWILDATVAVDLITNPDDTVEPEPTWELVPKPVHQNIFETHRSWVISLPANVRKSIEDKLKNPNNPTVFIVPLEYANAGLIDDAHRVYAMKQMGIDGREVNALSLKRSIIVSANYDIQWSIVNAMTVFSTERVIGDYNVPNALASLMPPSFDEDEVVNVGDQTTVYSDISLPFMWGWLEQHPAYQMVSNNRIQISQEWIYNKWSVGTYGLYDITI